MFGDIAFPCTLVNRARGSCQRNFELTLWDLLPPQGLVALRAAVATDAWSVFT
jgi:hypothetical protein